MMFKDTCSECGQVVAATQPQPLGFAQAVHLHDEHPTAFEELAESARKMNEIAAEEFDDGDTRSVDDVVSGMLDNLVDGSPSASVGFEKEATIETEKEAEFQTEDKL